MDYVPGIIALGIIARFGTLVASVTAQRERGVLECLRATPVPVMKPRFPILWSSTSTCQKRAAFRYCKRSGKERFL